mgnify:CR=1 FL=1
MAKPRPKPKKVKYNREELGAGVKALFNKATSDQSGEEQPEKELVQELANTIVQVPVAQIETNPHQPRSEFDEDALQELADSIQVHGLIQPITVRFLSADAFQLISGERRLRASKLAGLTEVPAYVRVANDQEMMEMALIENIQREDLNAMEIADTYLRLKEEFSLTDEQLSTRVGKKRATVTNYMRLRKLPPEIQQAVIAKKISMGHARTLAGIEDVKVQLHLFKKTIQLGLSVRALEKMAAEYSGTQKGKKSNRQQLPAEYENVQQNLRNFFHTKRVDLKLKGKDKGQIVISFNNVDELNNLLDRLEE